MIDLLNRPPSAGPILFTMALVQHMRQTRAAAATPLSRAPITLAIADKAAIAEPAELKPLAPDQWLAFVREVRSGRS